MKDIPILFSGPMVRDILEGRKTMTRLVAKHIISEHPPCSLKPCPYGQPGDTLWVRETWGIHECVDAMYQRDRCEVGRGLLHYRADEGLHPVPRWRPSIHMPRWASRITLRVTSVRVERLQEITEADARAEGVSKLPMAMMKTWAPTGPENGTPIPMRGVFSALWGGINAKRGYGWAVNPFVWVIGFEVVEVRK